MTKRTCNALLLTLLSGLSLTSLHLDAGPARR